MGFHDSRAGWLLALSMSAFGGGAPAYCWAQASAAAPQAQPENVRLDYGRVLRAEPVYEARIETWLEQQCDDGGRKLLERIVGAVKDVFIKSGAQMPPNCRQVPVEREFRRLVGYDVDYMYKGAKYRSRIPYDPGNRIKLRVSVAPYATAQPH